MTLNHYQTYYLISMCNTITVPESVQVKAEQQANHQQYAANSQQGKYSNYKCLHHWLTSYLLDLYNNRQPVTASFILINAAWSKWTKVWREVRITWNLPVCRYSSLSEYIDYREQKIKWLVTVRLKLLKEMSLLRHHFPTVVSLTQLFLWTSLSLVLQLAS